MDIDMITITFPQVRVEIPIKDLTFDTLEDMIFDMMQKLPRWSLPKCSLILMTTCARTEDVEN